MLLMVLSPAKSLDYTTPPTTSLATQPQFVRQAQALVDGCEIKPLAARLQALAEQFCPVVKTFGSGYHWSLMQVEYALDVVFTRAPPPCARFTKRSADKPSSR